MARQAGSGVVWKGKRVCESVSVCVCVCLGCHTWVCASFLVKLCGKEAMHTPSDPYSCHPCLHTPFLPLPLLLPLFNIASTVPQMPSTMLRAPGVWPACAVKSETLCFRTAWLRTCNGRCEDEGARDGCICSDRDTADNGHGCGCSSGTPMCPLLMRGYQESAATPTLFLFGC